MAVEDYKVNDTPISDYTVQVSKQTGIRWNRVRYGSNYFNGLTLPTDSNSNTGAAIFKTDPWPNGNIAIRGYRITENETTYALLHKNSKVIKLTDGDTSNSTKTILEWDRDSSIDVLGSGSNKLNYTDIALFKTTDGYLARATLVYNYEHDFVGPTNQPRSVLAENFKKLIKFDSSIPFIAFYATGAGGSGGRGHYFKDQWISRGGGGGGGGSSASAFGYIRDNNARTYSSAAEVQTTINDWLEAVYNKTAGDPYDSDILLIHIPTTSGYTDEGDGDNGTDLVVEYLSYGEIMRLEGGKGGKGAAKSETSTPAAGGKGGTYSGNPNSFGDNVYSYPGLLFSDVQMFNGVSGRSGMLRSDSTPTEAGTIDPISDFYQGGYAVNYFGGFLKSAYPGAHKDTRAPGGRCFFINNPAGWGGAGGLGGTRTDTSDATGDGGYSGTFDLFEWTGV